MNDMRQPVCDAAGAHRATDNVCEASYLQSPSVATSRALAEDGAVPIRSVSVALSDESALLNADRRLDTEGCVTAAG